MSFFELKDCDIISSVYTANPNYDIEMSGASGVLTSQEYFIFQSTSVGSSRTFQDLEGNFVTGSFNLGGRVSTIFETELSATEKRSVNRLRNIYASSSFAKTDNYTSSSVFNPSVSVVDQDFNIINIPQILYGSKIQEGSIFFSTNGGQEYYDDSYGGIYSGSLHIGCAMYQHGIILLGSKFTVGGVDTVNLSFSGTHKIPMNLYLCRAEKGELNFSQNPSYTSLVTGSNYQEISTTRPKTFISAVGLYDEDHKLVGVAKVSSPILNEEDTNILFKLKLVF